jgi:OOP family OmpA-OmpF porin
MSYKFIAGFCLCLAAGAAIAQTNTNIAAPTASAYGQDNQGNVTRSQYGLCWRTGYWTPDNSISGCDGELSPPITNPTAPALTSNPAAVSTSAPPATSADCSVTVTLKASEAFRSGQATLSKAAQQVITRNVVDKLSACGRIDGIVITGHADRLGSQKFNQAISLKRAEAVAAFLKSKNVDAPIQTIGAGNNEPLARCADNLPAKKLASCLSPDRRVVISVQGHEK